ncbi:Hypothetical predicted protein, partial [Mytilus galloprovincialis]
HECANDYVKCRDGIQCINRKHLCDGTKWYSKIDCADNSDEDPEFCKLHACASGHSKCRDGIHCFPDVSLCDGRRHFCPDGSDKNEDFCK